MPQLSRPLPLLRAFLRNRRANSILRRHRLDPHLARDIGLPEVPRPRPRTDQLW